jgi:hypothetical protein
VLYTIVRTLWKRSSFSLFHGVDTASGAQCPIKLLPKVLSAKVKRLWREANYSPSSSAETMNTWSYTSTPDVSMAWCLLTGTTLLLETYQINGVIINWEGCGEIFCLYLQGRRVTLS